MRRTIAFHEAGHVAAALVLGCQVTAAWLHDGGGETVFSTPNNPKDSALIALAGTISQMRAVPGSPLTASDDFDVIDQCADRRGCRDVAEALVEEHWDLVECVARELLEHGELRRCAAVAQRIGAVLTEVSLGDRAGRGGAQFGERGVAGPEGRAPCRSTLPWRGARRRARSTK